MKKFIALLLTLICVLSLVGCNTKSMNYIIENKLSDDEILSHLNSTFEQIQIKISTHPSLIPDVTEWINNTTITYNENGNAEISGTATNSYELISKIISFAPKLKLLSPKTLINKIKQTAQTLTELYSN